jgi:hypothetical protein
MRPACSAVFGGRGAETIDATHYQVAGIGSSSLGAATNGPATVYINRSGPFFNPPASGREL